MRLFWSRPFQPVTAIKPHCHKILNKRSFFCHKRALTFVVKAKNINKNRKSTIFISVNSSRSTFAEPLFQGG